MRSPFHIFRKHQKEATVILIGMAMFAFVIIGSLTNVGQIPPWVWIVLLALVLGGIFWVVGTQTGKGSQKEYAFAGAVLGAALGFFLMALNRPAAAVTTTAGNITTAELRKMGEKRRQAINFMTMAFEHTVERPQLDPMVAIRILRIRQQIPSLRPDQVTMFLSPEERKKYQQFLAANELYQRRFAIATFRTTLPQPNASPYSDEEVVKKYLLLQEAKELGIQVSDDTVWAFIDKMTDKKLAPAVLTRYRESPNVNLSTSELLNVLRDEIAAQLAFSILAPEEQRLDVSTPYDYWKRFLKMKVKERLEMAEVPVKPFIDVVKSQSRKPSEKELDELFEKYKDKFPSLEPTPGFAFGLPERVQIAFFHADRKKFTDDITAELKSETVPGEEQMEMLKKIRERVEQVKELVTAKAIKPEDAKKRLVDAQQRYMRELLTSGRKVNRLEFDVVKYYEENKSKEFQNDRWARRFPKVEEIKPVRAPAPQLPKFPESGGSEKSKPPGDSGAALPGRLLPNALLALQGNPVSWLTSLVAQPGKTAAPGNKKTAPGKTPPPKVEKRRPLDAPKPVQPFLPLDSERRESIRKKIIEKRVADEIRKRMLKAQAFMQQKSTQYKDAQTGDGSFDDEAVSKELAAKAKELGLLYDVSQVFGRLAFERDEVAIPLTGARLLDSTLQGEGSTPLIQILFPPTPSSSDGSKDNKVVHPTHDVIGAYKDGLPYVLWKTSHLDAKVPELAEVRDEVVKAWTVLEARKLAEARAKELMQVIKDAKKPMAEAVVGKTVTGATDSDPIRARWVPSEDQKFSWLTVRRLSVPGLSLPPAGQVSLTPIPVVDNPIPGLDRPGAAFRDERFRETAFREFIFNKLKDGEIGVTPNLERTTYFVVRVVDREPVTEKGFEALRKELLTEELFGNTPTQTTFYPLNSPYDDANAKLRTEVIDGLFTKYNVKFLKTD